MMETFSSPSGRATQRSPASPDESSTLPRSSSCTRSLSYTVNTTVHGLTAQPNEQHKFHSGASELWTTSLWQVGAPTAIFTHGSDRSSRSRGLTLPSYQWSLCGMSRAASAHARSAGIGFVVGLGHDEPRGQEEFCETREPRPAPPTALASGRQTTNLRDRRQRTLASRVNRETPNSVSAGMLMHENITSSPCVLNSLKCSSKTLVVKLA